MPDPTRSSLLPLCLCLTALAPTFPLHAQTLAQVEFDPRFLGGHAGQNIDLSRFGRGNVLEPGVHAYDVYLNGDWLGRENIQVRQDMPAGQAAICYSPEQIKLWNINESALPDAAAFRQQMESADCVDVHTLIPDFLATPVISDLALHLSIPQAYIARRARGYVGPENWQQGIAGGFVNYNLNAFHTHYREEKTQRTLFGAVNAGFNFQAWRIRHNASYTYENHIGHKYRSLSTYVQRDIAVWRSQLTMGQSYTQNTVFNSVPYTGIQINSDDRMLPDSLTGFAPVVQGVADTNAKVSVFQGDNQIYETSVPPGPFTIDDLYNTGYAGDLEVVITEADGQTKRFTVPYASVAQLLRPGLSRYSLTAGRYRDRHMHSEPNFVQATYQRGMSNLVSAYGGAIAAEHYLAAQLGLAFNTTLGAIAFDATHSHASNLPRSWLHAGGSSSGQSYRLSFSKLMPRTSTNITLAAYRFSSSGYLTLTDFARARNPGERLDYPGENQWGESTYFASNLSPQRHRFQLSVSQQLAGYGSLYISGTAQNYWNSQQGSSTTYQLGYNKSFSWGNMNLNVSRYNNGMSSSSTQTMLSLNIPLGRNAGPTLSTSVSRSSDGNTSVGANIHGNTGERKQISYAIYNTYQDYDRGHQHTAGGSLQYDGHHAQSSATFSASSRGTRQTSLSLNGSVVAHSGGVNFVRNQGDTFAILYAPGAAGASINGNNGSLINQAGYGVASNLIPYRNNSVSIDPNGSSLDVEIVGSIKSIAPTAGAIVLLEYDTRQGQAVLLSVRMENGEAPPMGAEVLNPDKQSVAQVGQGGRVFLRGMNDPMDLLISWGPAAHNKCVIPYTPPTEAAEGLPFARQTVQCSPATANLPG